MKAIIQVFLESRKQKRFSIEELERYIILKIHPSYSEAGGYRALAAYIEELSAEGVIKPVRAQKQNGLFPPLHNVYHKVDRVQMISEEDKKEILYHYHPKMSLSGYMHLGDQYRLDKPFLEAISAFLRLPQEEKMPITLNERSFDLFRDEKWLGSDEARRLLQRIQISEDDLCCYRTYEPFFYYQRPVPPGEPVHVLIVENKDTFDTFKRLLQKGVYTWNQLSFSMLIYGEGKKIIKSLSYIHEIDSVEAGNCTFHYFGDIDPEGLFVCTHLEKNYTLDVRPFVFLYKALIQKHLSAPLRKKEQQYTPSSYISFYTHLEPEEAAWMKKNLEDGRYLPQEGLNQMDFLALSEKGRFTLE